MKDESLTNFFVGVDGLFVALDGLLEAGRCFSDLSWGIE